MQDSARGRGDLDLGSGQDVRDDEGARRARPRRRDGRGARFPRAERLGQDDDDPGAARAAPRRPRRGDAARRRPVARRGRPAPAPGVRAGRRHAVAEAQRRRGHRPPRSAARRPRPATPRRAARALRARPDQEGADLLEGQPQKVGLVAALASSAELLILDEPTSGLDPLMEAVFQDCIRESKDRGPHRPAVEPHPRRGRGALRPGEHHPRRPDPADAARCRSSAA